MLHKPSESICAEMNALPQPSAFGINELTTDLVLRCVVDEFELLACGCVCKLLERRVDEARDGAVLRARRARRKISPWHVDTAHGNNDADGTKRRPLRSITVAEDLCFESHGFGQLNQAEFGLRLGEVVVHCASGCMANGGRRELYPCAADGCGDPVCPYHGSGVGEIRNYDNTRAIAHFEPSTCAHGSSLDDCSVTYCTLHKSRLRRCDPCRRNNYNHPEASWYCPAHITQCRGALWRRDTKKIPRILTQRASFAGEDPQFGALHECAFMVCVPCMATHKCGDIADLEFSDDSDDY